MILSLQTCHLILIDALILILMLSMQPGGTTTFELDDII